MYKFIRPFFFSLDPELAHHLSLKLLSLLSVLKLNRLFFPQATNDNKQHPIDLLGLSFSNPVCLAAGLDKNGDYIKALSNLGFAAIEVGTVTPRPQAGNPKPRLFRLPEAQAIINRMGFNNKGVDHLINNIKNLPPRNYVLGVNIGKNIDTAVENAFDDYAICLEKVFLYADYVTINISSPNTPGLRHLQFGEELKALLSGLNALRNDLTIKHGKKMPLLVKVAPDMSDEDVEELALTLLENNIDGVIATNTTVAKDAVKHLQYGEEAGGLSGKPVYQQSTHVVEILAKSLAGKMPVIAVGGIFSAEDAAKKLQAGAQLVQIYTGFIYQGPNLIRQCIEKLTVKTNQD